MINNSATSQPLCTRCGNCCRWPGFVRILPEELETIARFLDLTPVSFVDRFTRLHPSRTGLILTEAGDGACVFLEGNTCRIQPVKPRQCRDFPTVWRREELTSPCQAQFKLDPAAEQSINFAMADKVEATVPPLLGPS